MSKLIKVPKSKNYLVVEKFLNGHHAYFEGYNGLIRITKVEAAGRNIYMYGEDGNIYYYDNSHW